MFRLIIMETKMEPFDLNLIQYKNKIDLTQNDIKTITNINYNLALYFLVTIDFYVFINKQGNIYYFDHHHNKIKFPCSICYSSTGDLYISYIYKNEHKINHYLKTQFEKQFLNSDSIKVLKLRMYITFNQLIKSLISKRIELLTISKINIPDYFNI